MRSGTLPRIFSQTGIFRRIFSIRYINIIFRGSSEDVVGAGGAQRPPMHVNGPKKTGARSARARKRDQDSLVTNNITDCNVTKQNVPFELISELISGRDIRIFRERAEEKNGSYNVHTSKNLEEDAFSYTVCYFKISLYMTKSYSIFFYQCTFGG